MQQISLGDQVIRYDRERTKTAYSLIEKGSAEQCGCPYCRNFLRQRITAYPPGFLVVLDQLGIDLAKEADVYEGILDGAVVEYCGWFYLAGELIEPGDRMTDAGPVFQYFFSKRPPQSHFGEDVLALEFSTKLPWIISEQPEWL